MATQIALVPVPCDSYVDISGAGNLNISVFIPPGVTLRCAVGASNPVPPADTPNYIEAAGGSTGGYFTMEGLKTGDDLWVMNQRNEEVPPIFLKVLRGDAKLTAVKQS